MTTTEPKSSGLSTVSAFKDFMARATLYVRVWTDDGWEWFDIASGADHLREFMCYLEPAETYRIRFTVEMFGRNHAVDTTFRT